MPLTDVAPIEASTEIAAPIAHVWALVGDPRNMARWSPQTVRSFLRGKSVRKGAKLINVNRKGLLVWPTQSMIVAYEPEREIAWRVKENYTVWRIRLEPTETGTRVVQTREAPQGISDLSVRLTNTALGGVDSFTELLRGDMATTLGKIKADAER